MDWKREPKLALVVGIGVPSDSYFSEKSFLPFSGPALELGEQGLVLGREVVREVLGVHAEDVAAVVALGGVLDELGGLVGRGEAGGERAQAVFRGTVGTAHGTSIGTSIGFGGGLRHRFVSGSRRKASAMEGKHTAAAAGTVGEVRLKLLVLVRPRTGYFLPVVFDLSIAQMLERLFQFAHLLLFQINVIRTDSPFYICALADQPRNRAKLLKALAFLTLTAQ